MLNEIVKNIQVLCDYKVNDMAALNIIQAKLAYTFSLKDIKFQSIQNVGKPKPIAYYAFNFIPSGGVKNLMENIIDDHLLSFVEDYLKAFNAKRLEQLECKQIMELQDITDKVELRRKKQEQEQQIKQFKKLNKVISNATQAKIYSSLEIIDTAEEGAILILNSEFANFYEDAILNKDKTKKEFLDMLYNLYDGEYQGTDTVSTNRENIYGIPVSGIFLSDYKLLNENEKLCNSFKSYLARGMARRSFIFFKKNENYYTQKRKYPSYDEKQQAIENLAKYSSEIKSIFDSITLHKTYSFTAETNKRINDYKQDLDGKIAEFYKYTNKLTINNEILKLNLEHSTWKIIKLAVLYHILDSHNNSALIKPESFDKAVNFFEQTHACLKDLLDDKFASDYDNLYNFLIEHRNQWVPKMELRNQGFVPNREFKNWFEDAMIAVGEVAEDKGFAIAQRVTGKRNQGIELTLYEPSLYTFISRIEDNVEKGHLQKISGSDLVTL